jgi:hypothetical protein
MDNWTDTIDFIFHENDWNPIPFKYPILKSYPENTPFLTFMQNTNLLQLNKFFGLF